MAKDQGTSAHASNPPAAEPINPPRPKMAESSKDAMIMGFAGAVSKLQGGVPAAWADAMGSAATIADMVPGITRGRLSLWCKQQGRSLDTVCGTVLSDILSGNPHLLEVTPEEISEELSVLLDAMWPRSAITPLAPPAAPQTPDPPSPVLDTLRDLATKWHKLSRLPRDMAKSPIATTLRATTLTQISIAKAQGMAAGLRTESMMRALESAGDRWSWEVPMPASEQAMRLYQEFGMAGVQPVYLDERGQTPTAEAVQTLGTGLDLEALMAAQSAG